MTRRAEFYDRQWAEEEQLQQHRRVGGFRQARTLDRFTLADGLIVSGRRFLDLGCGQGQLLARVHGRFEHCVGVDVSAVALAQAAERGLDNVDLQQLDLDQPLPFAGASFDTIACIAVAEHVFDLYGLVDEIARVLEPAGRLIFEVPNIGYLRHRLRLLSGRLPQTSDHFGRDVGWDGGHLHYFTLAALRDDLLRPAGLRVEYVTGSGLLATYRNWWPSLLCGDLMVVAVKDGSGG